MKFFGDVVKGRCLAMCPTIELFLHDETMVYAMLPAVPCATPEARSVVHSSDLRMSPY